MVCIQLVIKLGNYYFHNKGRIILFRDQNEAVHFLNMFEQYSMQRLAKEGRVEDIMRVHMIVSQVKIFPMDFKTDEITCGTVLCGELL